jgi:hypothetical protein
METIQMSCLGDKYAKECSRASTLNVEMQNYLIQMEKEHQLQLDFQQLVENLVVPILQGIQEDFL